VHNCDKRNSIKIKLECNGQRSQPNNWGYSCGALDGHQGVKLRIDLATVSRLSRTWPWIHFGYKSRRYQLAELSVAQIIEKGAVPEIPVGLGTGCLKGTGPKKSRTHLWITMGNPNKWSSPTKPP